MSEPSKLETTTESSGAVPDVEQTETGGPASNGVSEPVAVDESKQDEGNDGGLASPSFAPVDIENGVAKEGDQPTIQSAPEEEQDLSAKKGVTPAPEWTGAPEQHETTQPKQSKKKKPQAEVNPDFQELQQTGGWGRVSKLDFIVAVILVLAAVGIAIVVAVVVHKNKSSTKIIPKTAAPISLPSTAAPSAAPKVSADVQLAEVLRIIANNTFTNSSLQSLPNNVAFYKGLANDTTQAHEVRAMSWLLYDDTLKHLQGVEFRYSLAALYYGWGGDNWNNSTNWLKGVVSCDWFGVQCDIVTGDIIELDFTSNNLVGTIPNELALLTNLVSLSLSHNHLDGTLPGDVVGSLPVLSILNLANNDFTGSVPSNLNRNKVLRK